MQADIPQKCELLLVIQGFAAKTTTEALYRRSFNTAVSIRQQQALLVMVRSQCTQSHKQYLFFSALKCFFVLSLYELYHYEIVIQKSESNLAAIYTGTVGMPLKS